MKATKQKYVYVVLFQKDNSMLLNTSRLPFYWKKGVADFISDNFKGTYVKRVLTPNY